MYHSRFMRPPKVLSKYIYIVEINRQKVKHQQQCSAFLFTVEYCVNLSDVDRRNVTFVVTDRKSYPSPKHLDLRENKCGAVFRNRILDDDLFPWLVRKKFKFITYSCIDFKQIVFENIIFLHDNTLLYVLKRINEYPSKIRLKHSLLKRPAQNTIKYFCIALYGNIQIGQRHCNSKDEL